MSEWRPGPPSRGAKVAHTEVDNESIVSTPSDAAASLAPTSGAPATIVPRGNPDTVAEVPSHAWGWSGESPKAFRIAAVVVALLMLAMLRGNHVGHVEDLYLIGFAAALLAVVGRDIIRSRRPH
ncbi:MAG: DUF2631 domain-containing protein [Mycobacteriaceae bacterium]|nr:DUF2631 domain-containing protein [Mycobacteriaceae bacterium]